MPTSLLLLLLPLLFQPFAQQQCQTGLQRSVIKDQFAASKQYVDFLFSLSLSISPKKNKVRISVLEEKN